MSMICEVCRLNSFLNDMRIRSMNFKNCYQARKALCDDTYERVTLSIAFSNWRMRLFKSGCGFLILSAVLYFVALVVVPQINPLQNELRAGAAFFLIGSLLNLLSALLMMFGYGWKRLPLIAAAFLGIFFWFGFTLY